MAIHQEELFDADKAQLFKLLTDSREFSETTGAPAKIDAAPGGAFSCFGGQIEGRMIDLAPGERVVEAWRVAAWPKGVYSLVTFALKADGAKTRLSLNQSGHPADAEPHLEAGWDKMYWSPIRARLAAGR